MARENQGLKIALIVFLLLTIVLGVTTWASLSSYLEQKEKALAQEGELTTATREKQVLESFNQQLKKDMLGSDEAQQWDLERVTSEFNLDMETYTAGYDNVDKSYRRVLAHLYDQVNRKNVQLADANAALQALGDEYKVWKSQVAEQVKKHEAAAQEAKDSLKNLTAAYESSLAQIRSGQSNLQSAWNKTREDAEGRVNAVQTKLDGAVAEIETLNMRLQRQGERLEEMNPETPEVPDGEIRWVDQATGTVWIDLGRADSLRRLTTFSIYSADLTNLAKARKKGSIEVIQIRGEHLAEARVLEDIISDPIVIGDKVYTPVWNPGESVGFAMVGLLDIDGDGVSDLPLVKQLIELSGGKVDCWIDSQGNREGEMTLGTRYLVVDAESLEIKEQAGEAAGKAASTRAAVHSAVIDEARRLGIRNISLADLLRQMGWKSESHVVQFGREADVRDFQPQPAEGVPRVSTGKVSGLFEPRRAPAGELSPRGGAY